MGRLSGWCGTIDEALPPSERRMGSRMVHVTEAVFSQGVLKPIDPLGLREQQRVRLIIEPVDGGQDADRTAALMRLRAGIASMSFSSSGPLPARDELHDRP
jgi:predicted DNA-binding antitoxin AbrB/MazE fold protein